MNYDTDTKAYSYILTLDSSHWLKIASNDDLEWYGYENIIGDIDSAYITYDAEHYDIILEAGTYEIIFDPNNKTIEFTVQ